MASIEGQCVGAGLGVVAHWGSARRISDGRLGSSLSGRGLPVSSELPLHVEAGSGPRPVSPGRRWCSVATEWLRRSPERCGRSSRRGFVGHDRERRGVLADVPGRVGRQGARSSDNRSGWAGPGCGAERGEPERSAGCGGSRQGQLTITVTSGPSVSVSRDRVIEQTRRPVRESGTEQPLTSNSALTALTPTPRPEQSPDLPASKRIPARMRYSSQRSTTADPRWREGTGADARASQDLLMPPQPCARARTQGCATPCR